MIRKLQCILFITLIVLFIILIAGFDYDVYYNVKNFKTMATIAVLIVLDIFALAVLSYRHLDK